MIKYYCDRCGKEIKESFSVDLPCDAYKTTYQIMGIWMKRYDLCSDCVEELKNWVKKDE